MSLVHTLLKRFQVQFFLKAELGMKRVPNMERLMPTKCVLRLVKTIMESPFSSLQDLVQVQTDNPSKRPHKSRCFPARYV